VYDQAGVQGVLDLSREVETVSTCFAIDSGQWLASQKGE
jgi:hypothetical protein